MPDLAWTREQAEAIRSGEHTLLAASAGTGKTTTVIGKIRWLLGLDLERVEDGTEIEPSPDPCDLSEVAAITFTEKAAYDLKRQLRKAIERSGRRDALLWRIDRAAIGTIHGFCGDLLREHALRFGIDPGFRVLDEREARVELDELIRDLVVGALRIGDSGAVELVERYTLDGFPERDGVVDHVRSALRDLRWRGERYGSWLEGGALSAARVQSLTDEWEAADDVPLRYCEALHSLAVEAGARWERRLEEENARDFDGLILTARDRLLDPSGAAALASIRQRWRILVIDEFQDTDAAQRDVAFAIGGLRGPAAADGGAPQLFLVGDPKQSIYRFRGADVSVWNAVREELEGRGRLLDLTRNFRGEPRVIELVNGVCAAAMEREGEALAAAGAPGRVRYVRLEPARPVSDVAELEWMAPDRLAGEAAADRRTTADDVRNAEAELVAARIRDIVFDRERGDANGVPVIDPGTGERRECRYRDVAILFRARKGIEGYARALERYGVPYYLAGDAGFTDRQEVLDLLTVLGLIDNPRDDLRAFAFLRSPFVGLRDEVIARIRLEGRPFRSLLRQAEEFLETGDWLAAPEHDRIAEIEREALDVGLRAVRDLSRLRSRLALDELLEEALDRTGYRLHLLMLPGSEPALANIQRFLQLLQGYRDHTLGAFLEIWDRWENQDLGIPQAPLYSRRDDVVTLSTVHSAKGLEWPVVFFADAGGGLTDQLENTYWSDPELGPILCGGKNDRGPRSNRLHARRRQEELAEETRLLYVALTRARDRLAIAGPTARADDPERASGYVRWLGRALSGGIRVCDRPPAVQRPAPAPEPALAWLDAVEAGPPAPLAGAVRVPDWRFVHSASELTLRCRSRYEWRLRYRDGVIPRWEFTRDLTGGDIPGWARGKLIHDVLRRIEEEDELPELLEEAIGTLDVPELEERLIADTAYLERLESEIARVVSSDEWRWYVEGEHYRELDFVQLAGPRRWRIGAFDLYRPGGEGEDGLIIDFKTHDIGAEEIERAARDYRVQAAVYRAAAAALAGPVKVRLHFTKPNRVLET